MDLYGYGSCFVCILTRSPGEIQQFQGEDASVGFFFVSFGFGLRLMSRWTKQTEFPKYLTTWKTADAELISINWKPLKPSDPVAKDWSGTFLGVPRWRLIQVGDSFLASDGPGGFNVENFWRNVHLAFFWGKWIQILTYFDDDVFQRGGETTNSFLFIKKEGHVWYFEVLRWGLWLKTLRTKTQSALKKIGLLPSLLIASPH